MKISRRTGALLLLLSFAAVLFLSSAYMIHEADHECCGHDCPVCAHIARMAALMESFALAGAVCALFVGINKIISRESGAEEPRLRGFRTPVAWKVRLND